MNKRSAIQSSGDRFSSIYRIRGKKTGARKLIFLIPNLCSLISVLGRIMTQMQIETDGGEAMPAKRLNEAEIAALLPKAQGWTIVNGKLHREFASQDFVTAFANMTRVALVAEKMDHHPEWFNVWNKVIIDLTTHSVKGISDYDFVLAEKINEIFDPPTPSLFRR